MTNTPATVHVGPWRAVWNGGRLMDVFHDSKPNSALGCVQVGPYDWQRGALIGEPTETDLRNRLADWVCESSDDYTRNALPYA